MNCNFTLRSNPEWIKDAGTVQFKVDNFNLSVSLIPMHENGRLSTKLINVQIEIDKYNSHLQGETDISTAIDVVFREF